MPGQAVVPTPKAGDKTAQVLSLNDAVLLSLRFNPQVQTAELNRVTQKFSLILSKWYFDPQYSFNIARSTQSSKAGGQTSSDNSWTVTPAATLNTAIGTQLSATSNNEFGWSNRYSPTVGFQITQPLLKGFGQAVTEASLNSAIDSEEINKLNLKDTLGQEISAVIEAYITVINQKNRVLIDKETLKQDQTNLKQTLEEIKAGSQSRSDAIQYQSSIATDEATLQSDQTQLQISMYQLLDQIGLDPEANIDVEDKLPMDLYKPITLEKAQQMGLANNISYQSNLIQLREDQRSLMLAKDAMRWGLSLSETYTVGGTKGVNALYEGAKSQKYYDSLTTLTLTIPIDDMNAKSGLLSATIGLQTAEISLQESKRQMSITIISAISTIDSEKNQIKLDERSVDLAKQTLQNTIRQYQAGTKSSLDVTSQQQALANAQRSLANDQMSYFQSLVNLDSTLSHTTDTWNVTINY